MGPFTISWCWLNFWLRFDWITFPQPTFVWGCWRATPTGARGSWVFQWRVAGWPCAFSSTVVAVDRDHPDHEVPGITSDARTGANGPCDLRHDLYLARGSSHGGSEFDKASHTHKRPIILRSSSYRSIVLSIDLLIYLSIYRSIDLFIYFLFIYPSTYLCLNCHISIYIYTYYHCIFLSLSICLSGVDMAYLQSPPYHQQCLEQILSDSKVQTSYRCRRTVWSLKFFGGNSGIAILN